MAIERLRRHFEAEAIELTSALESTGADVVGLCNAGSLFGDARLVVVEAVDGRRTGEGRLTGGWKAADVDTVAAYLDSPAPGTVLALVGEEVKRDAKLAKACAKAGEILGYDVAKKQLVAWVAGQFKQRGTKADQDACAALVELAGENLHALANEVEKLSTWAIGSEAPVSQADVARMVPATAEIPIFELTDAWARRDVGGALDACESIYDREGRPRRDVSPRLAGALGAHAGKLKTAKRLSAEGIRAADALGQLGTRSRFYADKLYAQAEAFSDEELREATVRLADLDLALKGDSRLAPDLELQRALIDVTRPPGRR